MDKKIYYKIELLYVKYSPMILSAAIFLNSILNYYDIYLDIFNYLFGTSLLTLGHMYNSSKVFQFCKYHRMFIHYIAINIPINAIDNYIGFSIDDFNMLMVYMIISAIFLFLVLYWHQVEIKK
jgi:hypothetical protein